MALILPLRFIFIHFIKKNLKVKKLFFFDNGVVNRLQGFFEFEEIKRTNFLGRLFESFISKIFANAVLTILKNPLYYFRDYQNHEIDLIYKRGNIVIPIESTSSFSIPPKKLINFKKIFALNPNIRYGLIFYLGEVKTFFIKSDSPDLIGASSRRRRREWDSNPREPKGSRV